MALEDLLEDLPSPPPAACGQSVMLLQFTHR